MYLAFKRRLEDSAKPRAPDTRNGRLISWLVPTIFISVMVLVLGLLVLRARLAGEPDWYGNTIFPGLVLLFAVLGQVEKAVRALRERLIIPWPTPSMLRFCRVFELSTVLLKPWLRGRPDPARLLDTLVKWLLRTAAGLVLAVGFGASLLQAFLTNNAHDMLLGSGMLLLLLGVALWHVGAKRRRRRRPSPRARPEPRSWPVLLIKSPQHADWRNTLWQIVVAFSRLRRRVPASLPPWYLPFVLGAKDIEDSVRELQQSGRVLPPASALASSPLHDLLERARKLSDPYRLGLMVPMVRFFGTRLDP